MGFLIWCASCSPGWVNAGQVQMKGKMGKFPRREKKRKIKRVLLGKNETEGDEKMGSKSLKAGETCYRFWLGKKGPEQELVYC